MLNSTSSFVIEARVRRVTDSGDDLGFTRFATGINTDPSIGQNGDTDGTHGGPEFTTDYHRFSIRYDGSYTSGEVDGQTIDAFEYAPIGLLSVYLWTNARTEDTTVDIRFDWVLVRGYASVEPEVVLGDEATVN